MSPDSAERRWQTVDALFLRMLDTPAADRTTELERATRGDPGLRSEVASLLDSMERSEGLFETPALLAHRSAWADLLDRGRREGDGDDADASRIGDAVGPYRLTRRIGRGGMATVYEAGRVDGEWEQTVAVKLIRRGLDTEDLIRRFRTERQILSSLEHPNIARLLDGGSTDDGLPYLVMERVEGVPITRYCDERRLSVADRIRLFCDVARAVQYAHTKLVVHRDLKASNILVTDDGAPRLLDFGIAKVLDAAGDDGERTRIGRQLLTPEYASPEQIAGEPVTTRTDVYQLGVLLCVMLAGNRPRTELPTTHVGVRRPSSLAGERAAAAAGTTPSALRRRLRGDLDVVTAKALRTDPAQRYGSVDAMVADLEAHLERRPVAARPPTMRYRLRKLLARHPWLAPTAAAVLVTLAGYGATLQQHARELEVERNLARSEAERAQQAQDFLVDVFRSTDPYRPASERDAEITVREALDVGVDRIRTELAGRPVLQANLLSAIGDVYANLGLGATALPLHEESWGLAGDLIGKGSPQAVSLLRRWGTLLLELNRPDSAIVVLEAALARARTNLGAADTLVAQTLMHLGRAEHRRGRFEASKARLVAAAEVADRIDPPPEALQSSILYELSLTYPQLGDPSRAVSSATRALELSRSVHGPEHATTAVVLIGLADALHWADRNEEAVGVYRQGITALTSAFGPLHPNVLGARNNLALRLQDLGDLEGAETALRELLAAETEAWGPSSSRVATSRQNLAVALVARGRTEEAEILLIQAHEGFVASMPEGHYLTAFPLLTLASLQLTRGAYDEAEATSHRALRTLRAGLPPGHFATGVAECRLGQALFGLRRTGEARPRLLDAADILLAASSVTPDAYMRECLEAAIGVVDPVGEPDRMASYADALRMVGADGGQD